MSIVIWTAPGLLKLYNFFVNLFAFQVLIEQKWIVFSIANREIVKPASAVTDIPKGDTGNVSAIFSK